MRLQDFYVGWMGKTPSLKKYNVNNVIDLISMFTDHDIQMILYELS